MVPPLARFVLGTALASLLGTSACAVPTSDDATTSIAANTRGSDPADVAATDATRTVLANLHAFDFASEDPADHRILIGQEESDVSNRSTNGLEVVPSDVEQLAGRAPALVSYELSNVDKGSLTMFDAAAFRRGAPAIRDRILAQHSRGVLVNLLWHLRCPKTDAALPDKFGGDACPHDYRIDELLERKSDGKPGAHFTEWRAMLDELADLLLSLEDEHGELVPVQIRPFHEQTGNWFWWGRANSGQSYIALWREMVSYLRDARGIHNVLWVFSPAGPSDTGKYTSYYPGDGYVDVVGFSRYDTGDGSFVHKYEADLATIDKFSRTHGKVAVVAEVGTDLNRQGFADTTWFSTTMLAPLKSPARKFAYVALWRNAPWEKFIPEPGDGAIEADFQAMAQDSATLFAGERNLYTAQVAPFF